MQNLLFTLAVIATVALFAISGVVFYKHEEADLLLFLQLVRSTMVQALSFVLPLSLLISVVFVYGRASADHEVTTIKASGIHPWRLLWPGAVLALLLSLVTFEVESRFAPRALHDLKALPMQEGTMKVLLEKRLQSGERTLEFDGDGVKRKLLWERMAVAPGGGVVLEHVLYEQADAGAPKRGRPAEPMQVQADRGVVLFDGDRERIVLRLEKPVVLTGASEGAANDALIVTYDLTTSADRSRLKMQDLAELHALELRGEERSPVTGASLLRWCKPDEVEGRIQQRLSRAATPLVFLLLGVPLALVFKSGNRMIAFLLATVIGLFVYYPAEQLAGVLMKQQLASPLVACWSGNVLLAAIGGGLLVFVVKR